MEVTERPAVELTTVTSHIHTMSVKSFTELLGLKNQKILSINTNITGNLVIQTEDLCAKKTQI